MSNSPVKFLPGSEVASGEPAAPAKRHGHPVDGYRLYRAAWRGRKALVLAAVVGCVAGVAAAKLLVGHTYEAFALMVFEGLPEVPGMPDRGPAEFNTLMGAVRMPSNLVETMKRRHIDQPLRTFQKRIEVDSQAGSNRVTVSAQAETAADAAKLADTVVDVFIEYQTNVEATRLRDHLETVESDLSLARTDLGKARRAYDSFRELNGIANLTIEQEAAIKQAADLQAAAAAARVKADEEATRARELRAALRQQRATTIVTETQSSPDLTKLAEARTALAQARAQYSADHPKVLALQAEVQALQGRAKSAGSVAAERVLGLNPTYTSVSESAQQSEAEREAALQNEKNLQELSRKAQERVAQLSKVEGEASKLLAAVDIAGKRVSDLEAIRAEVQDAARSPAPGFRVEQRAERPEYPIKSRARIIVAAAVPTAVVLLVIGFLAAGELWGFRVKTAAETGYWGRGPVIGTTTWPRDAESLDELLGEFDDYLPDLQGATLVVGATKTAVPLAHELAKGLMRNIFMTHQIYSSRRDGEEPAGLLMAPARGDDAAASGRDDVIDATAEVIETTAERGERRDDPDDEHLVKPVASELETSPFLDVSPAVNTLPKVGYWDGPEEGPAIRRAARLADRVLVVVPSDQTSVMSLLNIGSRLGRRRGIGYVVVNLDPALAHLPDRSGNPEDFWFYFKS